MHGPIPQEPCSVKDVGAGLRENPLRYQVIDTTLKVSTNS
jgi:hypothetical protein